MRFNLDGSDGLPILINKKNGFGAAAERLDTKGACSSEEIKHACIDNPIGQTGKDCGFHAIHRRPDTAFGNLKLDSASGTRDHSHGAGEDAESAGVADGELTALSSGVSAGGAAFCICFFFFALSVFFPPSNPLMISFRS